MVRGARKLQAEIEYYALLFLPLLPSPRSVLCKLSLGRGEINILGIIGAALLIVSVLAYPEMYIKFFRYIFDSIFGDKGVFEGNPKPKNKVYGPGGK